MHYEINVSRSGRHFFATAERSLTTEAQAREAYRQLSDRFPEPEFQVTVSLFQVTGRDVTGTFKRKKGGASQC